MSNPFNRLEGPVSQPLKFINYASASRAASTAL